MDTKITLKFDEDVIEKAKRFAEKHNTSLSRLTEMLLRKATIQQYASIEDIPVSSWVNEVAEGAAEYKIKARNRKKMKDEYYSSKK
jgi:antitoxin component of RelBE/YafQ-DinJ toxin-antitoxin module